MRSKLNLRNYSKILDKSIRLAKKTYYHNQFEKFKFDSRKTWATINDVLCRKKVKMEFPNYFIINGNQANQLFLETLKLNYISSRTYTEPPE